MILVSSAPSHDFSFIGILIYSLLEVPDGSIFPLSRTHDFLSTRPCSSNPSHKTSGQMHHKFWRFLPQTHNEIKNDDKESNLRKSQTPNCLVSESLTMRFFSSEAFVSHMNSSGANLQKTRSEVVAEITPSFMLLEIS